VQMLRLIAGGLAIFLGAVDAATAAAWLASSRTPFQPRPDGSEPRRGSMRDPAMAKIPLSVRALFGVGGLAVLAAGILLIARFDQWLPTYIIGWLLIQTIAIYNGLTAYGKLRWSHHIVRFLVFGGVFVLAYLSVR
jgi:hypothetical protein